MKALKYWIIAVSALISMQASAFVAVHIVNNTESVCKLDSYDLVHGLLYTFPPIRVAPGLSAGFNLDDSGFRGPEIELNYSCDGKKVRLTCQENMWILWAGQVYAHLDYADPGITARAETKTGSAFWGQAGYINWTIENQ